MSCFGGKMNEYQEISLDRFDGDNLKSTAYFLSHKHEDHMTGLSSSSFQYRLETNCHIKFYCSEVTRDLLKSDPRHRKLEDYIVALKVDVPYSLKVPDAVTGKDKYTVTVTPLHAGHCPGSVMFLFEGSEGTALYTGDIRLNRSDLLGFKSLHSLDSPKHIDSMYIDTTFCVPNALFIPTRDESAEAVLRLTKDWLSKGRNHFVRLKCSAGIGYEHLFIRLAEELQTKVHVSEQKHKEYKSVAAFPNFSTPDANETRIHCCTWSKDRPQESRLPCGYLTTDNKSSPMEVRTLMLSTMWFTQAATLDKVACARKPPYYYRVCYSFHSSYSEIRDMVIYLKPKTVRPNVIPYKEKDFSAVQERLNRFQKIACQSVPAAPDSQPKKLGLQRKRKRKVLHVPSVSSGSEGMDWGDLSPVKKPKMSQESSSPLKFAVDYKDFSSSQGSQKSLESEREEVYSSGAEDDDSDFDILEGLEDDEDVKLAKEAFKPVQSGSYGDYVSYVSDMSDEEGEVEGNLKENEHDKKDIEMSNEGSGEKEKSPKVNEVNDDKMESIENAKDDNDKSDVTTKTNDETSKDKTESAKKLNNDSKSEEKKEGNGRPKDEFDEIDDIEEIEVNEEVDEEQLLSAEEDFTLQLSATSAASQKQEKDELSKTSKNVQEATKTGDNDIKDGEAPKCNGDVLSEESDDLAIVKTNKVDEDSTKKGSGDKSETEIASGSGKQSKDSSNTDKDSSKKDDRSTNKKSDQRSEKKTTDDETGEKGKESSQKKIDKEKNGSQDDEELDGEEIDEAELLSIGENEENSSDVEEVGHVSGELGEYGEFEEGEVNGPLIDLTEDDEVSEHGSESLFSSDEEGSVTSGDYEGVHNGRKFVMNSEGELFMLDEEGSDGSVDENTGETDDEIVISSDEESPQKEKPTKQTARKSTAKQSSSDSHTSDINGCENGDNKSDSSNIIILEDSSDSVNLQNCNEDSAQGDKEIVETNHEETVADTDNCYLESNGEPEESVADEITETSAVLSDKLSSAKDIAESTDKEAENHAEKVSVENEIAVAAISAESEEL